MRKAKPKPRHAQPRAKQSRPNVVFRTDREVLDRLDREARRLNSTRSEVINVALQRHMAEIAAPARKGVDDANQIDLFA